MSAPLSDQEIPFARLGIPSDMRPKLARDAPKAVKLALARGLVPTTVDVQLAICYILATDPDPEVAAAANDTIVSMPVERILSAIHLRTHPKILEYLVEVRHDEALDDRVAMHKLANDRTVRLIARRANEALCEKLALNHERLIMTPMVYVDLYANEHCPDRHLRQAETFLRMQRILPEVPPERPFRAREQAEAAEKPEMDLEAEIMAAIAGEQSPALLSAQESKLDMFDVDDLDVDLGGFEFTFAEDTDELSFDLTEEREEKATAEEIRSMEKVIREMSPGQKIKLAYLGNREARSILIRDSNKLVAAAVVKSGRMTDGEALNAASNRNLADDVIREIASNREWVRKYPFQVALVNNPKTPVSVSMGFIRSLNKRDLKALCRNRNVPSSVNQAAVRLFKSKYKSG
ncbi:MAG: hypothetical protein D6798_19505 [Deltaproteobacteria bacterium]|nr:MAG: hypothetical protein D6798_19505 [Deltaproteobacteria bacterium]